MRQSLNNAAAVQQADYAVSHLSSLSVLPTTAIQYLSKFAQNNFDPDSIHQIIESNPALTADILSSTTNQDSILPTCDARRATIEKKWRLHSLSERKCLRIDPRKKLRNPNFNNFQNEVNV